MKYRTEGGAIEASLRTKTIVELRTLHRQTTWLLKRLTSREWIKAEYLMTAADQAQETGYLLDLLSRGDDIPTDDPDSDEYEPG